MKKNLTLPIICVFAIVGLLIAAGAKPEVPRLKVIDYPETVQNANSVKKVKKNTVLGTVSEKDFLYEDFEEATGKDPFPLPEGWTNVPTPGKANDCWRCGTLSLNGDILRGVSGYKYAFIYGASEKAHDAWAFSPAVQLEAGKEYNIELYAIMLANQGNQEILEVKVGMGAEAEAMTINIGTISGDFQQWNQVRGKFTPKTSGLYNIGLHSISPAGGNGTVIDNLKIWSGNYPSFNAYQGIDFGEINTLQPEQSTTIDIYNPGSADLEVDLKECSPGLTVSGFPATVEPDELKSFPLTINVSEPGTYVGEVVLTTNDPTNPEPHIKVFAEIKEPRVTGYVYEDFEHGGPKDWTFSETTGNVPNYGMDSGRSWWGSSFYSIFMEDRAIGFTTHYVEMGDNPVFSFCYKLNVKDQQNHPISPEVPLIEVKVSDDFGQNYHTIYTIEPDGEHQHEATTKYRKIVIPLPEYKNKTCCFKVGFSHASGSFEEAMTDPYDAAVDNVVIGTVPQIELETLSLDGSTLINSGEKCQLSATVENRGGETITSWTVDLINNATDDILTSVSGPALEPGKKTNVAIEWTPEQTGAFSLRSEVKINDAIPENNVSNSVFIEVLDDVNKVHAIQDGDSKKSFAFPVDFYSIETMGQTIYKANEIGINSGLISSLVYKTIMNSPFISDSFEIYVGETDKENFDDTEMVDISELTKVFEGGMYFPEGRNDFVVPFFTPYRYKGGNLVVCSIKKSKEFIYDKLFVNHSDKTAVRSLSKSTDEPGTLEKAAVITADTYPDIRINMVSPATGSISGKITDVNGNPVAGAKVTLGSTQLSATTNAIGAYSLPCITIGEYKLVVSHHDYSPVESESFMVSEGNNSEVNVSVSAITARTLKGKVLDDITGKPIAGVGITLSGYDDFHTITDPEGNYEISGIKEIDQPYTLRSSSDLYKPFVHPISIGGEDVTFDFNLSAQPIKPFDVKVSPNGSSAEISWGEPVPEVRHDSGKLYSVIGYNGGWKEIIFGTSFKKKALIKEISWYAASGEPHSKFNVFVFGLNSEGKPDPTKILYEADNVDYTDDAWSTHKLSTPIVADGFMIAVSCDGFMSIGITKPTEEYPFELNTCFYAGDSYNYRISEMATYEECHLMLRASCEEVDGDDGTLSRPEVSYRVYRLNPGQPEEEWTLIGETESLSITDHDFGSLNDGVCRYAVVAVYKNGEQSRLEYSVDIETSGVIDNLKGEVEIGPNPFDDHITIKGAEDVMRIDFLSLSGGLLKRIDNPSSTIETSDIPPGFCMIHLILRNGKEKVVKAIRK
ncbi:MAG: carboxypeptidase regulatory-like domain-containing protein [Muribaculaceae bacterium]|nr:carboxypeptidase regulatory-like domain-containing protein [Muribaculaceae bacterium]